MLPPPTGASPPPDRDGFFVGLAISGGGSRSANFGAACMFQLQRVGLLQRVDYISAVSGGSLPAAYYCLNDAGWNPGDVQRKFTHSFATDLLRESLMPWNFAAFVLSDWDRTDLLAGIFARQLFSRNGRPLTFADFRTDRPRLLINSTDLQSGRRFTFSNESFDELNSDLSKFPVSYAVAASSAVPVLLHPVTLRDFSTEYAQYRHLIDGGATDNLGIQTLMDAYAGQVADAKRNNRPDPYPNGVVLVVIDAHTRFNANLSSKSDVGAIGGMKAGLGLSATLVNRVSSANVADLILRSSPDSVTARDIRDEMQQLASTGLLQITDITNHTIRVVYLSLTQVNDLKKLPFANFSESVNSIATYFNISDEESYQLYEAAQLLVQEKFEPHLKQLVGELDRGATTRPIR